MADDSRYRLPSTTVPTAYRIRLEPDLTASTFTGTVEIDVVLDTPSTEIVLNVLDLELGAADVRPEGGDVVAATVTVDEALERATLRLDAPIPAGAATLRMTFRGQLNEQLVGFYRSTFVDGHGDERSIATTQLCATDARRCFPCFDEPALKATFQLTVVVAPELAAYSNAPVARTSTLADGRTEVAFRPTMRMSSYLVALAVGPFEQSRVVDVDGVPLSVVCTPGNAPLAEFALEVGAFALRFYAEYFDLPYPGEKVDLVGIPDFAYGAMENLGCITFREARLLIDPATASTTDLQDVAMVIAHELAHMWFGDLVTMQWWEGIWLNEAFATHMQFLCTDAFRPEWRLWVRFASQRERGLAIDALHTTRPIEFPVEEPREAMGMFDAITYQKGGAVLRMLEQYLGADVYRDGIRRYLREHAHGNTVTTDLWAALEASSGEPVSDVMASWILQGGHPTVRCHEGALSQAPFEFRPAESASAIGSGWQVPVLVRPLYEADQTALLLGDAPLDVGVAPPVVVNAGGTGVYRTSYDSKSLARLAEAMGELLELERAVLLGDTWALARAGECELGDVVQLARGLGAVVEPSSWALVEDVLGTLDRVVDDASRPALRDVARELGTPLLASVGWDPAPDEDERVPLVRASAIRLLGGIGEDDAVRDEARARFAGGALTGNLEEPVLTVVAGIGRADDAAELLARCRAATDPQRQERYQDAVGRVADEAYAVATFEQCFELFRSQDAGFVLAALLSNAKGGRAVWEAMAADFDATLNKIPPVMHFVVGMGLPTYLKDRDFAEHAAAFHRAHPVESYQPRIEQRIEQMFDGVAFAERVRPTLRDALSSRDDR
jgi:puromycin-sensitive aminopeptidase